MGGARSEARNVLSLRFITEAIKLKSAAGASCSLTHVRAHTESSDHLSVGNACADLVAKRALQTATSIGFDYARWKRFDLCITLEADRNFGRTGVASDLRWLQNDPRAQTAGHLLAALQRGWLTSSSQGHIVKLAPTLALHVRKRAKLQPELSSFLLRFSTSTLGLGTEAIARGVQRDPHCPLCPDNSAPDDASHLLACPALHVGIDSEFPQEVIDWVTDLTLSLPDRCGLLTAVGQAKLKPLGRSGTALFAAMCSTYAFRRFSRRCRLALLRPLFPSQAV